MTPIGTLPTTEDTEVVTLTTSRQAPISRTHPPAAPPKQSKTGAPMTRVLRVLAKGGTDEVKKLPVVGGIVAAAIEEIADISKDQAAATEAYDSAERIRHLIENTDQVDAKVTAIGQIAAVMLTQNAELLAFLRATGEVIADEELSDAGKELALVTYRSKLARDLRDVDRRLAGDDYTMRHIALLPLDDVYVRPRIAEEQERYGEQKTLQQLEAPDYLSPDDRTRLESERDAILKQRWENRYGEPFEQRIQQHRRLVVKGGPGAGKSTLIRFVARACSLGDLEMQGHLGWTEELTPVIVPLARFASARRDDHDLSFEDFLKPIWQEYGGDALATTMVDEMREGRVFLFLDGVDEIPGRDSERQSVIEAVERFLDCYRNLRCLITSRPIGYIPIRAANLSHFTLPPFTAEQVKEFVYKWYDALAAIRHTRTPDRNRSRKDADAMLANISRNRQVSELASNPLMLVILGLLTLNGTPLPDRRVELYHEVVKLLASAWNERRSLIAGIRAEDGAILDWRGLVEVLGAVAVWMRAEGGRIVHRENLKRKMAEILRERNDDRRAEATADAYLEAAAKRAGILEECGHDYYTFWHPTIEEYLAAVDLTTPTAAAKANLLKYRSNPRYREIIRLAIGYVGIIQNDRRTATDLIQAIYCDEPDPLDNIFGLNLVLAAECASDLGEVLRSTVAWEIVTLLSCAVTERPTFLPWSSALIDVAKALPHLLDAAPENIAIILDLATHSNSSVRRQITRLLASAAVNQPDAKAACEMLLDNDTDDVVQYQAAFSLARLGIDSERIWNTLFRRAATITAEAKDELDIFFESNRDRLARHIGIFLDSERPDLCLNAALYLAKTGEREISTPILIQALDEHSTSSHYTIAMAIVEAGRVDIIKRSLERWIGSEVIDDVTSFSFTYVVYIDKTDSLIPPLSQYIRSENKNIRRNAASILVNAGKTPLALPAIEQWLNSNNEEDQYDAMQILLDTNEAHLAIPAAEKLLNSSIDNVRHDAALFLISADNPEPAIPTILQSIESNNDKVRLEASVWLFDLGKKNEAVPTLIQLLHSENDVIREEAIELLLDVGDEQAVFQSLISPLWNGSPGHINRILMCCRSRGNANANEATQIRVLLAPDDKDSPLQTWSRRTLFLYLYEQCLQGQ